MNTDKTPRRLIIAIDGYSSTGKSTVSKIVAKRLGYAYIDTGAMYRMITLKALRNHLILSPEEVNEQGLRAMLPDTNLNFRYDPEHNRNEAILDGAIVEDEIRGMEVSSRVSLIATLSYVRAVLVDKQRQMGENGGVVMDGRDIGSVVFPKADLKIFMTCSPEVRAMRRYKELIEKGEKVTYEEIEENVRTRDYTDSHRAVSPLVRCEDAVEIDNGAMTVEENVEMILRLAEERSK